MLVLFIAYSFKFDKQDKRHTNIDKAPWQIKPIWVDRKDYPSEIKQYEEFFKSPVATAIQVGREKIEEYKKDNYELVIVVHEGHSLIEIIRVSSAWATLKNLLSQLAQQYTTEAEYTKQVEV